MLAKRGILQRALFACSAAWLAPATMHAQTISLYTAVDLALKNSSEVRMAQADVDRSTASVSEQKDAYIPSLSVGTSPGWAYGFPLGQPSLANVQSQALVFSFSQPDYIRSARAAQQAAQLSLKNTREKVALDAALDYIELSTDQQELSALNEQQETGKQLIQIEEDRVAAGIDSRTEATRARLTDAQLEVRKIQLQGHVEVVAERLAHLTGLPLVQISADPASIPAPPSSALLSATPRQSIGLQAAYASAKSKLYVAFGDQRQVDRPTFGLGFQYSYFATSFDNYTQYYKNPQANNLGIGVSITIPLFDKARKAHAQGSAADAAHAAAQAEQERNQETEQKLELSKNIQTLAAQERVAELQQQLAQDELAEVQTELQQGTGRPGTPPVTPKEEQQAKIDERRYTVDLLDARFQLMQAELNVLRSNDELETWAMQLPKP